MHVQDYIRVLRKRWLVVVAATIAGGLLAFAWTALQPRVYESHASVFVTVGAAPDTIADQLAADNLTKSKAEAYLDLAGSRHTAAVVIEDLGLTESEGSLLARVSVTNPADSAVLRITAAAPTAEAATALADAWVEATTTVVADFEAGGTGTGSVVALRVLDTADTPGAPVAPQVRQTVALGVVLGLGVGVLLAFFLASIDRRLRHASDIERAFAVPVIGELPFDPMLAERGVVRAVSGFVMGEAVRQLRTNLRFLDVDHPPHVMIVTSAIPGDGKSTVTIKLAEAIAASGQDVVVVDADLRRPSIAKYLDLVDGVGLTDVLIDKSDPGDVLQIYGTTGHLHVLGAGRIPPNPSELVGSDAMHNLLYSFPAETIVLVDTPPLVPVTDAAVLAARADGAIVVARSGRTTVDLLEAALRTLERAKARALGIILDGAPRGGARAAGAYAGHYSYEAESEAQESGDGALFRERPSGALPGPDHGEAEDVDGVAVTVEAVVDDLDEGTDESDLLTDPAADSDADADAEQQPAASSRRR